MARWTGGGETRCWRKKLHLHSASSGRLRRRSSWWLVVQTRVLLTIQFSYVQYPTRPWYQPMVITDPPALTDSTAALLVKLPDVVPMAFRSSPVAYWLTTTSPTSYSAAPFRLKMNHFLGYPSRFLLCLNMTGPTTLSCLKCLGRRPREYKLQFGGSRSLNSSNVYY